MAEIVIFWTTFFVMSFPQIILWFMKAENIEDAWAGKNEEEEEGEGEKKDSDDGKDKNM